MRLSAIEFAVGCWKTTLAPEPMSKFDQLSVTWLAFCLSVPTLPFTVQLASAGLEISAPGPVLPQAPVAHGVGRALTFGGRGAGSGGGGLPAVADGSTALTAAATRKECTAWRRIHDDRGWVGNLRIGITMLP